MAPLVFYAQKQRMWFLSHLLVLRPKGSGTSKSMIKDYDLTKNGDSVEVATELKSIVLGAGCFWGVQDAYSRVRGVKDVQAGYAGGVSFKPNYFRVSSGLTGHAEVVQIKYDPSEVSFKELLEVFWKIHNPSQGNRQGNDVGSQYRSLILFQDENDALEARRQIAELKDKGVKITTEVKPLRKFYPAEEEHQNYLKKNPNGYCHIPSSVLESL